MEAEAGHLRRMARNFFLARALRQFQAAFDAIPLVLTERSLLPRPLRRVAIDLGHQALVFEMGREGVLERDGDRQKRGQSLAATRFEVVLLRPAQAASA